MAIKRYESTGDIVGQFLPKIYTRRITLESIGNDPEKGETAVTVDYQIKDVLDQNGLGIITQTRKDVIDNGRLAEEDMQDDILKALKVIIIAVDGADQAELLTNQIYSLSRYTLSRGKSFEQALNLLIRIKQNFQRQKIIKKVNLARPAAIGFEFRNTIYQQFDINNNVVNIIPGDHTFILDNEEWSNIENLSIVCFSYFDFESLGLTTDNFSEEEARKLSYTVGDLTLDAVTRGGEIVSTASLYKIVDSGEPYYGPVHYHGAGNPGPDGYVGYMAGYAGADMGARLDRVQVPITKIQDFRAMQRTKMVNYQPDQLEYFNNRKPDLSFLDSGDKNFFKLSNIIVNYDKEEQETNIEFTADMYDMFMRNSRYAPLIEKVPLMQFAAPTLLMKVLNMRIVRRRMTSGDPGTTKLGSPKRVEFMPESEDEHIVIESSDGNVTGVVREEVDDEYGSLLQTDRAFRTRSFKCSDFQIADFHGTNGIYQYGVEFRIADNTKSFILGILERARRALRDLETYSQESKIPVFDVYNVRKPEENLPIGLSEDPVYSDSISKVGNYDTKTRTFTKDFIQEAKSKYDFREYVDSFKQLVYFSFGKSDINRVRRSATIQLENQGQTPTSALDSLNQGGFLSSPEKVSRTELYNMVNPSNTNPETIDSFITSFKDLVLEMEEYFGSSHDFFVSNEGSGYSSKGDYSFTVKRWFNSTNFDIDIDTFVHLEPFTDEVNFDYDLATPRYTGPRFSILDVFRRRLMEEAEQFEVPASNPVAISPRSLNLGNWVVCFSREYAKTKRDRIDRDVKEVEKEQRKPRLRRRRKRKGRSRTRWERKKIRLLKKKIIYLDPSSTQDTNAVSNFVTGLKKLSFDRGPSAPTNFLRSIETLSTTNFFAGLRSITDQLSNNIVNYGPLINAATLTDVVRPPDYPENPNECGLVDNTPKGFQIPLLTDYLDKQGAFSNFGFAQNLNLPTNIPDDLPEVPRVVSTIPPITTLDISPDIGIKPTLPAITPGFTALDIMPQIRSTSFPTGGIFDSAVVFPASSTTGKVPTFTDVMNGAVSGKMNIVSSDTVTGNGLGTAKKKYASSPSSKPMRKKHVSGSTPKPSFTSMEVTSGKTISSNSGNTTPTTPRFRAASRSTTPTTPYSANRNRNTRTANRNTRTSSNRRNSRQPTRRSGFSGVFGGFGGY